jgi:hypothetical protein
VTAAPAARPPAPLAAWVTHQAAAQMVRAVAHALGPDAALMPLKGTLLARTHYADVAERPIRDCDLLLVRPALRVALRRLRAAGFRVLRRSRAPGVLDLVAPAAPAMTVDLHTRPLPHGFGAVDARWLATGARSDAALFGVPVLVPDERRLLVHLLGNILKDHVFHAAPHTAEDVARVVDRAACPADALADALCAARLGAGGAAALAWVRAQRDTPALAALAAALGRAGHPAAAARARLAWLHRGCARTPPPWWARLLARGASDAPRDWAVGLAAAAAGTLAARLRCGPDAAGP